VTEKLLVLTEGEIERLLPMDECIPLMAGALGSLARGDVHQPLRMVIRPPKAAGLMGLMPAYVSAPQMAYGVKVICVFPGNSAKGKDTHQGAVLLLSPETGEPLALMNASAITAIRTAAVSGVATRLLAREDASSLAIIGAGVQARSHLAAMACARPIQRVRVTSRTLESARLFAKEMATRYAFPIEVVPSAEAAIREADMVVLVTSAGKPVLSRAWVSRGAHINAVGASLPTRRELDSATMAAAAVFVDSRESALNEAGDYLLAAQEGVIGPEHIRAELGELLIGARAGRTTPEEITVFKSLGLAVEDVVAAEYLYRRAREQGAGKWVEF
jgi:ornithine cyclodeaminase/alanine dehydrogenase-like protein (mu-crystallin family)